MKTMLIGLAVVLMVAGAAQARGRGHYGYMGGHYRGGHGSSHRGGHYVNRRTGNHYTHHYH